MSDSRFRLKGEFTIYARTFPFDMSLNWYASDGRVDDRIVEFFMQSHAEAWHAMQEERLSTEADRRDEEIRNREIAELARLRAKYPEK